MEWVGATALKTHDYAYDSLNRLVESTRTAGGAPAVTAYDLDDAGNRNEVAIDAVPETYSLDATVPDPADAPMNQYTQTPGDTADRVYDENGNLLETDQAVFRHDYRDRIVDRDDGTAYSVYLYDALGRRIEKTVDDGTTIATTHYLYDGARVAEEWDVPSTGSPTLSASYVYGLYIDEVLTMRRGGVDYYYHADDQHNVVKLTDNTGALLEAYDYADYGQPEFYDEAGAPLAASQFGNPYLFTGRAWDPELGYYYFRNRYLDPAHGRFASRDPLGLWGDPLNLGNGYTYAGSNPWSLVDPFGLEAGGNQTWWGWIKDAVMGWTDERYEESLERWQESGSQIEGTVDYNRLSLGTPENLTAEQIFSAGESDTQVQTGELAREVVADLTGAGGYYAAGAVVAGLKVGDELNDARKAAKGMLAPKIRLGQNGEVLEAFAQIQKEHLGSGTGTTLAARLWARVMGRESDDAGHLIGRALGGPGGMTSRNIIPQSPNVNRGSFKQFEAQIASAVRNGDEVFVRVRPRYYSGSTRPHTIDYYTRINGKTELVSFPNP